MAVSGMTPATVATVPEAPAAVPSTCIYITDDGRVWHDADRRRDRVEDAGHGTDHVLTAH